MNAIGIVEVENGFFARTELYALVVGFEETIAPGIGIEGLGTASFGDHDHKSR
jgi:hypothetical protein